MNPNESSTSSSQNDNSFYETPLNSPLNRSLVNNGSSTSDQCDSDVLSSYWQQIIDDDNDDDSQCSNSSSRTFDCYRKTSDSWQKSSPCESVQTLVPNRSKQHENQLNQEILPNWTSAGTNQNLLIMKFNTIVNHLKYIQMECSKTQMFEQQLIDLCQQYKQYREKLVQENSLIIQLLNELASIIQNETNIVVPVQQFSNPTTAFQQLEPFHPNLESMNHNTQISLSKLDSNLKYKLRKLPAMVKGYLVRRLMATEKVLSLKRIIHDTSVLLVNFKQNLITSDGKLVVTHDDVIFHKRLCAQLEKSCKDFYSLFFDSPIQKQMQIIRRHREHLQNVKNFKNNKNCTIRKTKSMISSNSSNYSMSQLTTTTSSLSIK